MNSSPSERPNEASGRIATSAAVGAALVAGLGYVALRVGTTLSGAFLPLAVLLLIAEAVLMGLVLAPLLPALFRRRDGQVSPPRGVPAVDTVVVVRDERLLDLRMALRACRELRGLDGLVVVGGDGRRGIDAACRSFGVPHLRSDQLDGLGLEPQRRAGLLLVVPASAWVSPDAAVALAPALAEEGVGAAAGTTVVHGVIDLLGSEGYLLDVDANTDLALRLDANRSAPPLDGPILIDKQALRSVGGIDWHAPQPGLAAHAMLQTNGWGTRAVEPPIAYRMAPADEAHALAGRVRRTVAWRRALAAAGEVTSSGAGAESDSAAARTDVKGNRSSMARRLAAAEPFAAPARLVVFAMPLLVAALGKSPVSSSNLVPVLAAAVLFWGTVAMARRLTGIVANARFGRLRSGVRTLGADLTALRLGADVDVPRAVDRARRVQFGVLGALLVSVILSTFLLTREVVVSDDLGLGVRLVVAASIVATAALVRDASTAYRQQRRLPRVHYDPRHDGDITDLSPTGYTIAAPATAGEARVLELDLPYPGERLQTVRLPGVVRATRMRREQVQTYVEIDTDHDTFEQLIYFCAVTAPTIAWLGGTARPVRHQGRLRNEHSGASH